ncbi:hypothetical protein PAPPERLAPAPP_04940 [Brevundimonas phage vB_BpoS-Papperlapapp]|uniref:Uncharacterized protein n=1 Tax=Brevundimonas phage vB_BpoS-Domovoi TaxID=2948598 RepID=A0A9E7MR65_9CAUD|nr:hypothetical protein DOMOVOI_03890 [Brevundimonas phage vB_BpoS-Domovoi]USN16235.1 hypothetical protein PAPPERLAPAPP_04940 [Brevundimonas phage vB_BpoS-Papperlapapp]
MTLPALTVDHYGRAAERAKPVLKRGDKVYMIAHGADGNGFATYTFDHWDEHSPGGDFFVSKSGIDELHPFNIARLNGATISFRDEGHVAV